MKKLLPAFALMLSASAFGFVSDWNGIKIAPEKTWLQTAEKKYFGNIHIDPKAKADLVKLEIKDGKFVIDVREFFREKPATEVTVRIPLNGVVPGKKARLTVEMSSVPATPFELFFEGQNVVDGKGQHFWKARKCNAKESAQKFEIEELLPATVKDVRLRLTFRAPAVYTVGACDFLPEVPAK